MKIALIQQTATEDRAANRQKGLETAREAARQGANVVCFSELAFDPFYPRVPATPEALAKAEPIPGPTTKLFSDFAREYGVVVILNLFEQDGQSTYDTSPVIDADGTILGVTRMMHITDYPGFHEKGYYHPGNTGAPVYETKFGKFRVAICYDRHYPEYMRALAVNGADLVFVPQAGVAGEWPEGLFEAELRVAAFQNGYYTALCNRVGKESVLTFSGESFVCDPLGNVIARAGRGVEEVLLCEIDLSRVTESHARRLFFRDRRSEIYRHLQKNRH